MNIYEIKELSQLIRTDTNKEWRFYLLLLSVVLFIAIICFLLHKGILRISGCLVLIIFFTVCGTTLTQFVSDILDLPPISFDSRDPKGAYIVRDSKVSYIVQKEFIDLSTEELSTFEGLDSTYFERQKDDISLLTLKKIAGERV